jgi:hypothetical protein
MCKVNKNNANSVPWHLVTMELVSEIDPWELWSIMDMWILNRVASDVQDHFINSVWLVNSSFKDKCWDFWTRVNHEVYKQVIFKILGNIFSAKTEVTLRDIIPQLIASNEIFLSYIIDRIVQNKLVNIPLSVFRGAHLTVEQYYKLNSVYSIGVVNIK